MTEKDDATEFLQSLPVLEPGESFCFDCHPGVVCFNECCRDLNCILSPYDVLRLRSALELPSSKFLERFTRVEAAPDTGFPLVMLSMLDDERKTCPFVDENGCTVYSDRPGACRTYPLGRGAGIGSDGTVSEQYVVVREDHCKGFENDSSWTTDTWVSSQDINEYNTFNDLYLGLLTQWTATGGVLKPGQFQMASTLLYQLDTFLDLIKQKKWFERMSVASSRQKKILEDEKERLIFAIEWFLAIRSKKPAF